MLIIFGRVVSIFLLIFVGYFANRKKILPDESTKYLINLMLYITAPCMAASSIYMKELSPEVIRSTVQVIAGAAVFFAVATVIAFLTVKIFNFRPKEEWGLYIIAMVCINSGFMGFPVTKAIFGEDIFYLMVMHNIIACAYIYGATPVLLNVGRKDAGGINLKTLKSMINPCTIGIALGVVMLLTHTRPPAALNDVVLSLSDATIPVSMIIVGVQLGSSNLKEMIKDRFNNIANIVSMIVIPLVTFVIVEQMDFLETDVKLLLVFAAIFPTAVAPAAIAEQKGIKANRLAEIVSITTVTSLVVIPVAAVLLMKYYY